MAGVRATRHHPAGRPSESHDPLTTIFYTDKGKTGHAEDVSASPTDSARNVELLLKSSLSSPPDERLASIHRTITISSEARLTPQFVQELAHALRLQSWHVDGHLQLKTWLPSTSIYNLISRCSSLLRKEGTIVEVPVSKQHQVSVVGDTHGQLHDVLQIFELGGWPTPTSSWIFNGDFVDRGAWGVEIVILLMAWKICMPNNVFLLRGNHETKYCTMVYGFFNELEAKYGPEAPRLYQKIVRMFAGLPLAATVNGVTCVLHGGLFRAVPILAEEGEGDCPAKTHRRKRKRPKRQRAHAEAILDVPVPPTAVGTLAQLRQSSKGGVDPDGTGSNVTAGDVLWSDPAPSGQLSENLDRGIGLLFGPEITEQFLKENGLKLVLRSHEAPDARAMRQDMKSMIDGYAEDHVTESGKLATVFSAPCYPQFLEPGEDRTLNKGSFVILRPPDFASPEVLSFAGAQRPQVKPFYDGVGDETSAPDVAASGGTPSSPQTSDDRGVAFGGQGDGEEEVQGRDITQEPAASPGSQRSEPECGPASSLRVPADDSPTQRP
mmetsp:Transcript_5838/g.21282  ORF Transcript_5838/g.21282 Transcript_5838/m.21282 type:complete len:550 (-) Transcript_5838:1664-3313(-)